MSISYRRVRGFAAVFALACIAMEAVPARALPGQSIAVFKTWAAGKKLLAGLTPGRDELSARPSFTLLTSDHGIAWRFDARTDGTAIVHESLAVGDVGKAPGTAQIRHDGSGYGFAFLQSLYGRAVAADYKEAHLVATVVDPTNRLATRFFRGARYGYETTNGTLVLATQTALQRDIALARRCAKSPSSCSE
jgi:hypothetical protein